MKKNKEKKTEPQASPLPDSYKKIINETKDVYLVIVGKAPYPKQPVGIPFCKTTWEEMVTHNCSGLYVLRALGISISRIKQNYTPRLLFEALARLGIVFLNVSYDLISGSIRKKAHKTSLQNALQTNKPVFNKASHIILCGEAKKNCWFGDNPEKFESVVHPDIRNKNKESWEQAWSDSALAKKYKKIVTIIAKLDK